MFRLTFLITCFIGLAKSQSNYADQANNIEYQGEGLPPSTILDGKVTKLDDLSPVIFLNRTKAALNCAAGSMQMELKFNEKFYGIAYADFDRNSACQVAGKGDTSYKLELPLKGCGTKQDPQRVFTNNIVVRFHPGLEMDGDEIITIVCRYPPPVAPIPPLPPVVLPHKVEPAPLPLIHPLSGFQILLIICAILFLSLLLLGLGVSYYCLRHRNVAAMRRPLPSSLESDSEITKLSGSSLGNLSLLESVKIPRAHALVPPPGSTSGSDGPLISDTLPSDYPSESHSEAEDVDRRSLPVSSTGSFENKGYDFYSEGYIPIQEQAVQTFARLPMAVKDQPKFDVQVRVKKVAPPSPPSLTSDTESSVSRIERNLSTILEQREESVRSMELPMVERTQFSYVPELHAPPRHVQPAPTFTRILRRQQEMHDEIDAPPSLAPARSMTSLNTEMTDTHSMTETIDNTHNKFVVPKPPPQPPVLAQQRYVMHEAVPRPMELPISAVHKPEITSHMVDDVFLRTITEKKTIEDIERHKRLITEYHARPKPVDQKWDVTIKNYPIEMREPPDWENFSDVSSASGLTLTPKMERAQMSLPPQSQIKDNKLPLNSPELVGLIDHHSTEEISSETFFRTFNIPRENPQVPNWEVLIRVLQPVEEDGPVIENAESFNSQLTMTDRMKWRQIITTESTLRTLLTEAVIREDFERIRHDQRYERLFEPPKWDVIIRILTPERPKNQSRFRRKADWDTRSRRSSLPTLYEYDSDGGSSVRTITNESMVHPHLPMKGRRPSRSSYRSEADVRSMSEVIVDFARPDHGDSQSEASTYYPEHTRYYEESEHLDYNSHPQLTRSLSQPSLARSASEFTERWVAPSRYDTASEFTSPEGTPKSQRSTRLFTQHVPRGAAEHSSVWQQASSSHVGRSPPGAQIVTKEYRSEMATSFSSRQNKNWFGDNDSEANY